MQRLRGATATMMVGMGADHARQVGVVHAAANAFEEAGNQRRARELGAASPSAALGGAAGGTGDER